MNECKKEKRGGICFYNCDNIEFMKTKPDNYYDLAIVDPPYKFDIGAKTNFYVSQGKYNKKQETRPKGGFKIGGNYMDSINKPPDKKYFNELFRVSKNQIIWGGNYFTNILPPTTCWLVWDKLNGENYFGDFEMAWTSFGHANRMIKRTVHEKDRIHPTQKPVFLYKWIIEKFGKNDLNILDTHGGSGSIAIACHDLKKNLDICELDEKYFNDSKNRYELHKLQLKLF